MGALDAKAVAYGILIAIAGTLLMSVVIILTTRNEAKKTADELFANAPSPSVQKLPSPSVQKLPSQSVQKGLPTANGFQHCVYVDGYSFTGQITTYFSNYTYVTMTFPYPDVDANTKQPVVKLLTRSSRSKPYQGVLQDDVSPDPSLGFFQVTPSSPVSFYFPALMPLYMERAYPGVLTAYNGAGKTTIKFIMSKGDRTFQDKDVGQLTPNDYVTNDVGSMYQSTESRAIFNPFLAEFCTENKDNCRMCRGYSPAKVK